jgi:tetratricopeptide (TPR) repeat protein
MKLESVVFGIAGVFFGLIVGWVIGSQQATTVSRMTPAVAPTAQTAQAPAGAAGSPASAGRATILDESRVQALRTVAQGDPGNATARVELGNMYFDAERYDEAIPWYTEALKLIPKDVSVSTDLGVSYYYTNQADRALKQFDYSLGIDPKHLKTLLNMGVVRAFAKQDLEGASAAWKQVIALAPGSPEGETARKSLDAIAAGHANLPSGPQGPTGSPQ